MRKFCPTQRARLALFYFFLDYQQIPSKILNQQCVVSISHFPTSLAYFRTQAAENETLKNESQILFYFKKKKKILILKTLTVVFSRRYSRRRESNILLGLFQPRINTHLVLYWVFPAAGVCVSDWLQSPCPSQWGNTSLTETVWLIGVFYSFIVTMEL